MEMQVLYVIFFEMGLIYMQLKCRKNATVVVGQLIELQVIEFIPKRKKITRMQFTKAYLYLFKPYLTLPDINSLNWP
jgi:hypothetical protein